MFRNEEKHSFSQRLRNLQNAVPNKGVAVDFQNNAKTARMADEDGLWK
jgi:hypothetical protein